METSTHVSGTLSSAAPCPDQRRFRAPVALKTETRVSGSGSGCPLLKTGSGGTLMLGSTLTMPDTHTHTYLCADATMQVLHGDVMCSERRSQSFKVSSSQKQSCLHFSGVFTVGTGQLVASQIREGRTQGVPGCGCHFRSLHPKLLPDP